VKVNTDGAARGCPSFSTCAGIFRGSKGEYIGSFSSFLGIQKSLLRLWEPFWLLRLLGAKSLDVFRLSMTLTCFVKHLIRLISFISFCEEDGENA